MKSKNSTDYQIDNCKKLLRAILNCDDMDDRFVKYYVCVYDVYDNEVLIGVFGSIGWCAKFFNSTKEGIKGNIYQNKIRNRRYRILKLEKE